MTIPLIQEPIGEFDHLGVEVCYFCKLPTRTWHENTNNPVCRTCAPKHKVAELPDHGQAIRAKKRTVRKLLLDN